MVFTKMSSPIFSVSRTEWESRQKRYRSQRLKEKQNPDVRGNRFWGMTFLHYGLDDILSFLQPLQVLRHAYFQSTFFLGFLLFILQYGTKYCFTEGFPDSPSKACSSSYPRSLHSGPFLQIMPYSSKTVYPVIELLVYYLFTSKADKHKSILFPSVHPPLSSVLSVDSVSK